MARSLVNGQESLCLKGVLWCCSSMGWNEIRARASVTMGRKAGSLFINPKKFGNLNKPCMKEMVSFLNCIALNQNNDEKCTRHKELLNTCMDAQATRSKKPWGSINYHLQRLNRGRK
uniref:IMS import disulfide relay-system CHCH-CHCH-like Cx9C domain-containing protein n=2 Tax=Cucumis sativus TaxID=3659 RepID=A0A0A0KD09_CUCSA